VTPAQWFVRRRPLVGQPYVDTSYWSLVIDVFYAWVAAFIALGIFPRRIDAIILAWPRSHVARLRHLVVNLAQRRRHLAGQGPGHDHHVGLPRGPPRCESEALGVVTRH
jgi:hypothetical protein